MSELKKDYQKKILPGLKESLGYKNIMEAPHLDKVVVNVGINSQNKDPKFSEIVVETLRKITGQTPVKTQAKKSISGFKVRKGMVVGAMVTLRGQRMFDFIERLIKVTLPRLRDFRGLSVSSIDKRGNLTVGFKESIAFPEMQSESMERMHGLSVTVSLKAKKKEDGVALLKALGFPLREK